MNIYEDYISRKLIKLDFILGKDLNLELQKKFGVKSANARKIIERTVKAGVIKASSISFGNGQLAYVHPTKRFSKEIILQITKSNRPPLYRLITMLDAFDGVLPKYEALKISASPIKTEKSKSDSIEKLMNELEILNIAIQVSSLDGLKFLVYPSLEKDSESLFASQISRMSADTIFIPDVLRALQRINIIDNDKVLYRNKNNSEKGVSHNNYTGTRLLIQGLPV